MFKFAKNREVLWPVEIQMPVDGGEVESVVVSVRFKLLDQTELSDRMREGLEMMRIGDDVEEALKAVAPEELKKRNADLAAHITGWGDDIVGDNDKPLPFTKKNLEAFIQVPYIRAAFSQGLLDASRGAPSKNSRPGSDGSAMLMA